jgi:hypothetical protein
MRKLIFAFACLFTISGCHAQGLEINANELSSNQDVLIEYFQEFDILTNLIDFEDFEYVYDEKNNKGYLQAKAKTSEGANVILRVGAELLDGKIKLMAAAANQAESCTGNNCSQCEFHSDGGCACKVRGDIVGGPSYCNHSISR